MMVRVVIVLVVQTIIFRPKEPETRIVLGMPDDDNERTASLTKNVQTSPDELRAYALPLAIREHRHRGQAHPHDSSARALNHHWSKEDVTHNGVVLSHQ